MRRMGLVNCALAPLEPNMWTPWNTPDEELFAKIGPGEVTRAVPWSTLTAEQKDLQRTKMAIHAAMITRMDIGDRQGARSNWRRWAPIAIRSSCSSPTTARAPSN